MTPNLDALGHHWVAALAGYNMKLEYLKGSDNKVVDALSWVSMQKLDKETVTELLNYAQNGSAPWAETANFHVIEEGELVNLEVIVQYTQIVKTAQEFLKPCQYGLGQSPERQTPLSTDRGGTRGSLRNT